MLHSRLTQLISLIFHSSLDVYKKEFRGIYNILKLMQTVEILNYKNLTITFYKYI